MKTTASLLLGIIVILSGNTYGKILITLIMLVQA